MDKIICVGKNYADHAREVGLRPDGVPVVFLKPPSILRQADGRGVLGLRIPRDAALVEHECEVVLRLGGGGYRVSPKEAQSLISTFTLGLDMTQRDLQIAARAKGEPWTSSKVFIDAAVVGPWFDAAELAEYASKPFTLEVNGVPKQKATIGDMIYSPAQCVAMASNFFPLVAGDLLFTGSPAGSGPIVAGDVGRLEWGRIAYEVRWFTVE